MQLLERRVVAARRAAPRARPARRARAHRLRERGAGAALAGARRLRLRPADAPARHRLGHRPGAHGLRRARSAPCARRRAQLSRFVEDVYDARLDMPRRDPYEVLGVAARRRRDADQEGLPQARARAAPGRQRARPRRRGEVQGGRRGLRDPLRRRAPRDLRPLRPRGPALAAASARTSTASARSRDLFDAFFGGGVRRRRRRGGPRPGRRRRASAVEIDARAGGHGATVRGRLRGDRRAASTATATAPSRARRSRPASAAAAPGSCRPSTRTPFGQVVRDRRLRRLRRRRPGRRDAVRAAATAAGARCGGARCRSTCPRASPTASASASRAAATPASAAGRPATSTSSCRSRPDERFVRDGDDLVTVLDVPGAARRARHDAARCRRSTATRDVEVPAGHAAGRDHHAARRGHAARCAGPGATATCASSSTSSSRASSPSSSASCSSELADSMTPENLRTDESMFSKLRRACCTGDPPRHPRRAARTRRSRSPSCSSSRPAGVEEVDLGDDASSTRSTARRASCRTLPRPARPPPATRSSRSSTHRGRRRLGRALGDVPPPGASSASACGVRPPWVPALRGARGRHRPRPGVRHRRAPHDAAVPRAAARASSRGGALVDLGCGSGVLAIAAAKLGWAPVARARPRGRERRRRRATTPRANGVEVERRAASTCADGPRARRRRPCSPTSCARCCCASPADGFDGEPPRDADRLAGCWPHEADEVAAAFARHGLRERARRSRRRVGRAAAAPRR